MSDEAKPEQRRALEASRDRVVAGAELRAGDDVLDLAAGTGDLTFAAHEQIGDGWVVAVDPSASALEDLLRSAHEANVAGVMYLVGDIAAIPLPDTSVDACVTRSVLMAAEDLAAAAAEIARVLRPGGRLSSCEPADDTDALANALAAAGFVDVAVELEASEEPGIRRPQAWVTARRPS